MREQGFEKAVEEFEKSNCPICGAEINGYDDFTDPLSIKEYRISGMCQKCQDSFFD